MANSGSDGSVIVWQSFDREIEAGKVGNYSVSISIGDKASLSGTSGDVYVSAFLYVAGINEGSIVASESIQTTENDTVTANFSHRFPTNEELGNAVEGISGIPENIAKEQGLGEYPRIDTPVWAKAEIYYGSSGGNPDATIDTRNLSPSDNTSVPKITAPPASEEVRERRAESSAESATNPTLEDAFRDNVTFAIRDIEWEEDARYGGDTNITLEQRYGNPTVSIDSSGRFAKHEIIGGATVRQKVGEDPLNISVTGVCESETANKIDALRDVQTGRMYSHRLPGGNNSGGSLRVHFGSTSTAPMTDGGAADFTSGELLYSFTINAIEVNR